MAIETVATHAGIAVAVDVVKAVARRGIRLWLRRPDKLARGIGAVLDSAYLHVIVAQRVDRLEVDLHLSNPSGVGVDCATEKLRPDHELVLRVAPSIGPKRGVVWNLRFADDDVSIVDGPTVRLPPRSTATRVRLRADFARHPDWQEVIVQGASNMAFEMQIDWSFSLRVPWGESLARLSVGWPVVVKCAAVT